MCFVANITIMYGRIVGGGGGMCAGGGVGGVAALATENTDSLQFLNTCSRYDLSDKLKLFFGDDNDENVFLNDMPIAKS